MRQNPENIHCKHSFQFSSTGSSYCGAVIYTAIFISTDQGSFALFYIKGSNKRFLSWCSVCLRGLLIPWCCTHQHHTIRYQFEMDQAWRYACASFRLTRVHASVHAVARQMHHSSIKFAWIPNSVSKQKAPNTIWIFIGQSYYFRAFKQIGTGINSSPFTWLRCFDLVLNHPKLTTLSIPTLL